MLGCCVFQNSKHFSLSDSQLKRKISSTYRLYKIISHSQNVCSHKASQKPMKRLTRTGPMGEPMSAQSIWL